MVMVWRGRAGYGIARYVLTVWQHRTGLVDCPRESSPIQLCTEAASDNGHHELRHPSPRSSFAHRQPSRRTGRIKAQAKQEGQKLA